VKASIILPTYNEKENIGLLIKSIEKAVSSDYEIIVVDDNSPDGTAKKVAELAKTNERIRLILRMNERGLASAIGRGFSEAYGDILIAMDTDLSHPPDIINKLLKEIHNFDIVVASRYVKGGLMYSSIKKQVYLSKIINHFIRIALGLKIHDVTGGYFAIRKSVLQKINPKLVFRYYGDYFFEMVYYLQKQNIRFKEIPFTYSPRRHGTSKTKIISGGLLYLREVYKLRAYDSRILTFLMRLTAEIGFLNRFYIKYRIWGDDGCVGVKT
jgi:dolichol-phosphate mannosyltransferase